MSTAKRFYSNHAGNSGAPNHPFFNAPGSTDGRIKARAGGVTVKTAKQAPGNQGTKNSHTRPGAIKPNGTPAQMRQAASVTSTAPLQKVGPNGNKLGDKGGASNEARLRSLYPSSAKRA